MSDPKAYFSRLESIKAEVIERCRVRELIDQMGPGHWLFDDEVSFGSKLQFLKETMSDILAAFLIL